MILERLVVAIDSDLTGLRNITAGAARMERDVERNMTRAGVAADRFGDRLMGVGTKLTLGPTLAVTALGTASIISAGKLQQLRMGLDAVTGGGAATERQLVRLREVSKLPGLGFEEAVRGSINLQAAGFSAELAERALKGFGNALATVGRGRAELDGVIMALGQIASKGKISAEEINQLAERVPQIRQVMIAAFGTANTEQLQKMGIDATTFVTKVVAELEKLPPVTTGIVNSFENITDQSKITASSFGDRLVPAVVGVMDAAAGALGVLEKMPPTLKDLSIGAAVGVAALGPLTLGLAGVIKLGPVLIAQFGTLAAVGGPLLLAAAAMGSLTAGGLAVANNWKVLRYEAGQLGDAIRNRLVTAFNELGMSREELLASRRADPSARFGPLPDIRTETYSTSARNQLAVMSGQMDAMRGAPRIATPATPLGFFSAAGFQATARAVEDLLDRQKDLTKEAAKLALDVKLAEGTDAADKLKEKLAGVQEELSRVAVFLNTDMGKVWTRLQTFIDKTDLTGPTSGLLKGRGFELPKFSAKTSWKLELDPKTGLQTWKRITEGGIPVNVPAGLKPTTRAPDGTGADAATWWDDVKGTVSGVGSRMLDPKLIFSDLASQGIAALSGWVFGQVGSMLFGGGDRDAALREQARALSINSERLAQLHDGILSLDRSLMGEKGSTVSGVSSAIRMWLNPDQRGGFIPAGGAFEDWLGHFGTTIEDVDRLAASFGLTIRDSRGHLIASGLQQLAEALQSDFLRQLTGTFDGAFGLLRQEFELLDITDPMDRFQRAIDLVAGMVSGDLAERLRGLNPGNIDAFISGFLDRIRSGDLTVFDELNSLSVSDFLEFLGFAEGSLDQLAQSANKVSEALRNVPAGFKVQLARYRADDGLIAPPTARTGGGGVTGTPTTMLATAVAEALRTEGAGSTWNFTGPIYVEANTPEEFAEKIESQMQWRQRTGAYVIPTTTRRGG